MPLGLTLDAPGTYVLEFSVSGPAQSAPMLIDHETGECYDAQQPCTITVDAPCTLASRFTLQLSDSITAVETIPSAAAESQPAVLYDLQGRRVATPARGLYIRGGKKIIK